MTDEAPDRRVPAYLGRVLDAGGEAVGTCFQIAPGIVATVWHVLEDIGAGVVGAEVGIDPLAGGARIAGIVAAIDPPSDLAVVRLAAPLPAAVGGLAATDDVVPNEAVVIAGVARIDDDVPTRYLSGPGSWGGAQLRDDRAQLGWLASKTVLPGMSGAPVRRLRDDVVVGVVSGRYNSADGWLRDTVWVARCERLHALCADVGPLALETKPVIAPIDLLLTVDAQTVHLAGSDVDVSAEHGGVSPGLVNAVDETRRARANAGALREVADEIARAPGSVALDRAGRLLSQSFLPTPIADALGERLERATDTASTSMSDSETKPAWPPPTTSSACSPRTAAILPKQKCSSNALDIDERMGNQDGMAATISQLGFVAAERNELEQAIGLHGRALVIRVRIGIPEVRIDARQPRELRRLVSAESFARGLVTTVGENGAGQLVELLDGLDKAEDTNDDG